MKTHMGAVLLGAMLLGASAAAAQGNSGKTGVSKSNAGGGNPNAGGGNPNAGGGSAPVGATGADVAFAPTANPFNLTWTNVCSTAGDGGDFFSTCASASLFLYDNGWMELRYWNRAGVDGTFANSTTNAIGISNVPTASGDRGTAAGDGWQALFGVNEINWAPQSGGGGIPGPNTADGFSTNGQGASFCSDLATSCPGGIVTPWSSITGTGFASFYWFVGAAITSLNSQTISLQMHQQAGPNGWSTGYLCYSDQSGISSAVVGETTWECDEGDDPGGPQEVVPEPATMTLLATGLAGLAAARRRRKNNA